jgi:hypothetical protein
VYLLAAAGAMFAADSDHPTGNRTTPPTLSSVSPLGIARGTTVELTVEGLNLARASAVYFSEPSVTGKILRVKELPDLPDIRLGSNGTPSTIDVGPLPPRNQVTIEVEVAPDAPIGPVSLRVLTPLGTSPEGRFLIEPYYGEAPDKEPNDTPENAFETFLPAILAGTISRPGDVDFFKIQVKAGQEVRFLNQAMLIGSSLQPVVTILDADSNVIREFGVNGGLERTMFAHRFEKAGAYYIRVADYQKSGRGSHFYRIIAGDFPLAVGAPMKADVQPSSEDEDTLLVRPKNLSNEPSFNQVRVARRTLPEIDAQGGNVTAPVTINGRIARPGAENRYRFHARAGEQLVLEVNARRLGSDLDSIIEILDAQGRPIERATVRPVWETTTTLSERDSSTRGIRILGWSALAVGDRLMIGGEILQVAALPQGPDEDITVESFGGQRIAYFDTSTEAHSIDKPVYKVEILPPGAKPSPNGLPVARLYYRNDDGGPGYGKDSLLHFAAPADGDYFVTIRDVRGMGGDNFAYRLTLRPPTPDFRLAVNPRNPNVPAGGTVPVTVTATRLDGFGGAIDVAIENLPEGLHATRGTIAPGQVTGTILLSADANAKLAGAAPLVVKGRAGALRHEANPEDHLKLIALMPRPDLKMTAETREVTLHPGESAQITVAVARQGDYRGRIPVEVRNLPPRVKVPDVGLNGVLITEEESRRTFNIEALPNAEPVDQWIYVAGTVETRSGQQSSYASPDAIHLRVVPASK